MPQKWRRRLAAVGKLNLRYPVFWRANLNFWLLRANIATDQHKVKSKAGH